MYSKKAASVWRDGGQLFLFWRSRIRLAYILGMMTFICWHTVLPHLEYQPCNQAV